MIQSIKRELIVVGGGVLLIVAIVALALFKSAPLKEPYRPGFIALWKNLSQDILRYRGSAAKENVDVEALKELQQQMAQTVRAIQADTVTEGEVTFMADVSPFLDQVVEFSGLALRMAAENKEEAFEEAMSKMGFTLEEIAKITSTQAEQFGE